MVANVLLVVGAGVAIFQAVFLQVAGYTVFHLLLLTLRGRIDAPICQIVQNVLDHAFVSPFSYIFARMFWASFIASTRSAGSLERVLSRQSCSAS